MSPKKLWDARWFAAAQPARRDLWRGVEAQHRVATMRLVDNLAEQQLLEQILEASKPPLPPEATGMGYLIATPFRYTSPHPSRFRPANAPGIWYGADTCETVAAELAFWRRQFLVDSQGLRDTELVTEHTFFQARFHGVELDLTVQPWARSRSIWRRSTDYAACHRLAEAARLCTTPRIAAIRYESARLQGGMCQGVLMARALAIPKPQLQQTWICKTTRQLVMLSHDGEAFEFAFA